ncbi:MAG: biopolymer transporter ExbD [Proteobacteria bacterium]|nr:biopolymer transporter ExbD [Pseudomonadota bacterium]
MARNSISEAENVNLNPVLNLVLVMIPLLLLSVVFMTISVIEVTMPQRSAGAAPNTGEPPKRLQLFISKQGFTLVKGVSSMPAIDGCASDGPTICLAHPEAELDVDRHNWFALYNMLFDIKSDPDWAMHEQIEIVADPSINFGVLIKAMDVSRYQLVPEADASIATKGKAMGSVMEMNSAVAVLTEVTNDEGAFVKAPLGMFPVVVLGLPTMTQ